MRHWIVIKKANVELYSTLAEGYSLYSSNEYEEYERTWDFYHPTYKLGEGVQGYTNGFGNLIIICDDDQVKVEEEWD